MRRSRLLALLIATVGVLLAAASAPAYTVQVYPGLQPNRFSGAYDLLWSSPCTTSGGSEVSVTSDISTSFGTGTLTFSGTVYDDARFAPASGVKVWLYQWGARNTDRRTPLPPTLTDGNGNFRFRVPNPRRTALYWARLSNDLTGERLFTCRLDDGSVSWEVYTGISDPIWVDILPIIDLPRRSIRTTSRTVHLAGRLRALRPDTAGKLILVRVVRGRNKLLRRLHVGRQGRFSASVRLPGAGTYTLRVRFVPNAKRLDYFVPVEREIHVVIRERRAVVASVATTAAVSTTSSAPPRPDYTCPLVTCS